MSQAIWNYLLAPELDAAGSWRASNLNRSWPPRWNIFAGRAIVIFSAEASAFRRNEPVINREQRFR